MTAPAAQLVSPPGPSRQGLAPFAALACLLLVAAVHAPVVRNGWVLDDVPAVRENPALARGTGGLADVFRTPSWPGDLEDQPWRPLTAAWLALELPLWGGGASESAAPGLHAVNVALHAAITLLLLGLLRRAFPRRQGLAVGTALVFAVHPLVSGVVSSATGRADLLAALFGLLALHAWLAYGTGRPATLPLAALCYFLAVLAKESAVALPFAALVLDVARGNGPLDALKRRWPGYAALAVAFVLWLVLWPGPGRPGMDLPEPGAGTRLLLGFQALGRHVVDVLCPVALLPDRTVEAVSGTGFPFSGAAAGTTFLAGLAFLLAVLVPVRARGLTVVRGAVLAGGALALGGALVLPLGGVLEDRAAYLLLPALALLGGLALEVLFAAARGRGVVRFLAPAGAVAAVVALGLLAVHEASAWRDDKAVHERLFEREPGHGPAILRLARRLEADSRRDRAFAATLRADDPRYPGLLQAANDTRARGLELAERAAILPALRSDPEVTLLRANLYLDEGRPGQAEPEFRRARALEPLLSPREGVPTAPPRPRALARVVAIYDGLGRSYLSLGQRDRAADALEQAVRWDRRAAAAVGRPPDTVLLHRAAMSLISDGRFADGMPLLAEVAATAPDPSLRYQAGEQYAEAQKAAVERLTALLTQARIHDTQHEEKAALEVYLEALHVEPGSVDARERAAILLKYFGRYPEAKALVTEGLALLDHTAPGADTDKERARLRTLRTDLDRWERENAAEEERDMKEQEARIQRKRASGGR